LERVTAAHRADWQNGKGGKLSDIPASERHGQGTAQGLHVRSWQGGRHAPQCLLASVPRSYPEQASVRFTYNLPAKGFRASGEW